MSKNDIKIIENEQERIYNSNTMKVSMTEAKKRFSFLIQLIIDKKEDNIVITKYGKPIALLKPFEEKSKRIGSAKKELDGFDTSLETFNSIPIDNFFKD